MIDLITNGAEHQTRALEALRQGIDDQTDIKNINRLSQTHVQTCVCYGVRNMKLLKQFYRTVMVVEQGYFNDRLAFYSLGVGGLNNRADFKNFDRPSDRWDKHGVEMKPWKRDGEYYLVMGQVSGDMSIKDVDIDLWYENTLNEIQKKTNKPVYFRSHPNSKWHRRLASMDGPLPAVLKHAAGIATYNSNSGVDGILAGVPVFAQDIGSMAWPVAAKTIDSLISYDFPERSQWAYNLAYTQWSLEEFKNGTAWSHLWHLQDTDA